MAKMHITKINVWWYQWRPNIHVDDVADGIIVYTTNNQKLEIKYLTIFR